MPLLLELLPEGRVLEIHQGHRREQGAAGSAEARGPSADENRPAARQVMRSPLELTQHVFEIAALNIGENELMSSVQGWIQEEKASFLIRTLENMDSNLGDSVEALERY